MKVNRKLFYFLFLCFSFNSIVGQATAKRIKDKKTVRYLLITGCSRSGTMYITKVLQQCGLKVCHESDGQDGIVSWLMAAPGTETPFGPGGSKYHFIHIFHQVRDPLKAIPSICTEPFEAWLYISQHVPEVKWDEPILIRAAKYYYYWNKMAEKKAEWTYRIEDIEKVFPEMEERLGVTLDKKALKSVPKDTHTRGKREPCTWQELKNVLEPEFYQKLVKMAIRYGYEAKDFPDNL